MICYFSGTGNSKYVADRLAEKTGHAVFSINDGLKNGTIPAVGDKDIIIVSPTYAWRLPKVVDKWIREANFDGAKRIWFVMTCGGEIGNAGSHNMLVTAAKRLAYKGSVGIKMPDNYIIMFNDISQRDADALYIKAERKIDEVASLISSGQSFDAPKVGLPDKMKSGYVNNVFYHNVKADKYYSTEACISCGKCEMVCPLNNVSLKEGRPVWGKNCTHCMACISYCPVNAIEYGKKTAGKRRYTIEDYKLDK